MPVIGSRVFYVKATRLKDERPAGFKVDIELTGATATGDRLEIGFAYVAEYEKKVGEVRIRGSLFTREESPSKAEFLENCFKKKKIPESFFKDILSTVSYVCASEAALVVTPLGFNPPMQPIEVGEARTNAG